MTISRTFGPLKLAATPAEELQNFLQQLPAAGANPNNPLATGALPSANPSAPQLNPHLPGSFTNPANPKLNPNMPGAITNPANPQFNPNMPGAQNNPSNPQYNPAMPGAVNNPSSPSLNPMFPDAFTNPANPINNPDFPTPSAYPPPQGLSPDASLPPSRWSSFSPRYNKQDEQKSIWPPSQAPQGSHFGSYREALAEGTEGDAKAQIEPFFPTVDDAIEANKAALAGWGQSNHALLRPEVLDGALSRPQQYWHYTGSLPQAAAALAHGVGQAQAFEDGNKRTAYWLTHHFLHENGLGHIAPSDDEELADHLIGYANGTHGFEDTAQMFANRLGEREFGPKQSDNWQKDNRDWPDPTEPRMPKPPAPKGCTCHSGDKLNCPIHGLNADYDELDHTWALPEGQAVSYPQDSPRSWSDAFVSAAQPQVMYHVAPSHLRETIQTTGLRNPNKRTWVMNDQYEPGLYAWDHPEDAERYRKQQGQSWSSQGPYDIWALHGVPAAQDPFSQQGLKEMGYQGNACRLHPEQVSPEFLNLHSAGEPEHTLGPDDLQAWYERYAQRVAAGPWDSTVCAHCGKPMTEPKQLGNKWMNHCTYCGLWREVPTANPLLQLQRRQEDLSPYPDLLKGIGPERPWVFGYTLKDRAA